ncbi:MAG: hypothetical protein RLO21_19785 [Nitratireductor sp.]
MSRGLDWIVTGDMRTLSWRQHIGSDAAAGAPPVSLTEEALVQHGDG